MAADDNSGEAVILPWSVVKVSTHKMAVSDLVDGMEFYKKFVEDLRARNDPLLPEALRVQGQLIGNLTPQQANAIYQEMLRRRQSNLPR